MTTIDSILEGRARQMPSERGVVIVILVVAAVAWLLLIGLHGRPGTHGPVGRDTTTHRTAVQLPGHGTHPQAVLSPPGTGAQGDRTSTREGPSRAGAASWYLGWGLMVVAMMLPPALPMLGMARRLGDGGTSVAAAMGGFVAIWLLAGLAILAAGTVLAELVSVNDWLAARPEVVSGSLAVAAGVYQLTPLKRACLIACRSPFSIAATTLTGARPVITELAIVGWRFGLVCVGCCWALMILGLTAGAFVLPLMVALAVLMAAERLLPAVRMLVPVAAAGAMAVGALILLQVIPPGLS